MYPLLHLVAIGPSVDSCILSATELQLVTSSTIDCGGSGGRAWSQPSSIRRKPFTRRSHSPICLSDSLPAQLVTEGPVYALPVNLTKIMKIRCTLVHIVFIDYKNKNCKHKIFFSPLMWFFTIFSPPEVRSNMHRKSTSILVLKPMYVVKSVDNVKKWCDVMSKKYI